jgi:hypothetical protein
MVLETLFSLPFNHLMWLEVQEYFIVYTRIFARNVAVVLEWKYEWRFVNAKKLLCDNY